MEISFYIDREDAKKIEEEEKNKWIKDILLQIGIPLDDAWPDNNITVTQKIELRKLLDKYDILILDDGEKGVEIYVDDDIIAKWEKLYHPLFL